MVLRWYKNMTAKFTAHIQPIQRDILMPKKVLIALPPAMLEQVDFIAKCEHRTRSDLIRESLRRYLENFRRSQGAVINQNGTVVTTPPKQADETPQIALVQ